MKQGLVLLALVAMFTVTVPVKAAPVTLEFTGVIRNSPDAAAIGKTFTGFVTYDASNIEEISSQGTSAPTWFGTSDSGCGSYVNSVCTQDRGSGQPVVTDYQIHWEGGVIRPWDYSLTFSDESTRVNSLDWQLYKGWGVRRNQYRTDIQGDLADLYTLTTSLRQFVLQVSSQNDALLPESLDDFEQQFYTDKMSGLFFGNSYFLFRQQTTVETCTAPGVCTKAPDAGNFEFSGFLKVLRFRTPVLPVTIDIKPTAKTDVNIINLAKDRTVDVAIKASQTFDVSQVDPGTVLFGASSAVPTRYQYRDYNGDGFIDVVFTFALSQTGIKCGDTSATLFGQTVGPNVVAIQGMDTFATIGCN